MADSVNWSKLRKQAIDLKALDLSSNWPALRQVLVVLTGALIFVGCALPAVLAAPLPAAKQQQPEAPDAERMAEARRVEEVLAQANRRVRSGDVIGARDMLAAAEDGARGPVTFALAETYDPNMLAAWGSRGRTRQAQPSASLSG